MNFSASSLPDRNGFQRGTTSSRAVLNARDQFGRTILHHVASSQKPTAIDFALVLLEEPSLDIYVQDWESGWTALHRALYAGNIAIAQALVARDVYDATSFKKPGNSSHTSGSLIKIKDREGYSPFDVYGATITSRDIKRAVSERSALLPTLPELADNDAASDAPSTYEGDGDAIQGVTYPQSSCGDEVFTFGSNKNLNLGLGHQDDRQFPERVSLKRPEHLLQRFYREYQEQLPDYHTHSAPHHSNELPALIRDKPMKFNAIAMSKLHTAILTSDPESNLFICGFGPGGRLGTGDESTQFNFVCVETGGLAGKRVVSIALGQDHTLAITEKGEILSWGSNKYGQLGYSLPKSNNKNDAPMQLIPRQIFNPFKKEFMLGAAASSIHSVVFSSSGLYTFGKNEGQLGLVDSDARSLQVQITPRRVGASLFTCPIQMVSAIDRATSVLLQNHEVWVFSQYGYSRLTFPLDVSSIFIKNSFMTTRYDAAVNRIVKVTSGGNTICALSSFGEVFTVQVNKPDISSASASTTNPTKIRNSLSQPVRAWSVKKSHMAATDVDVGQDGSVIICTSSGSAWRKEKRERRTDSKEDASKDYKFSRIPGLSRVISVTSNAYGAYAVAQRDCDVTKEQIHVDRSTLWDDMLPLLPFGVLGMANTPDWEDAIEDANFDLRPITAIKRAVLSSSDIENQFQSVVGTYGLNENLSGIVWITSNLSDAKIPVHEFILTARSPVLRHAFHEFRQTYYFCVPDIFAIEYGQDGQCQIQFQGVDFLSILNLTFFLYTDGVLDVWHLAKPSSENAFRYRQVRTEVMRIATHLGLPTLERAARLMIEPARLLKADMSCAIEDPHFFESADVVVKLNGGTAKVHSYVICQRCPFFDALFHGRSEGRWISGRRANQTDTVYVDLHHIDPSVFDFVLRYMYADTEEQLFAEVRSKHLSDFVDLVIDVIFVANELMIDRLAQICQRILGHFVTLRNVCHLLNSTAPCYVREFKDAALEYICLNLGDMLENRLLGDLHDDLLLELDAICRDNQLTCYPVSRVRNSEDYIFEKYPEIVPLFDRDRNRRIDSMKLRSRLNQAEFYDGERSRPTTNEKASVSSTPRKERISSIQETPSMARSPTLTSKESSGDLMFQMDEEASLSSGIPMKGKGAVRGAEVRTYAGSFSPALGGSVVEAGDSLDEQGYLDEQMSSIKGYSITESPSESRAAALHQTSSLSPAGAVSNAPWGPPAIATAKKDLKDIMAEASQSQLSNLTLGMSASRDIGGSFAQRLSQKERKKIQQQQMQDKLAAQQKTKGPPQNPWQIPTASGTVPAKQGSESGTNRKPNPTTPDSTKSFPKPSMTLRQTIAGTPPPHKHKAGITVSQSQGRSPLGNMQTPSRPTPASALKPAPSTSGPSASPLAPMSPQPAIQSIRHIPRPEPHHHSFHSPSSGSTSLATIFLQQQTEKEELREAAMAKHNLQDIQAEQEFQEWWDKESKRVREQAEAEAAAAAATASRSERGRGKGQGQSQGTPRKRRPKGTEKASDPSSPTEQTPRPVTGNVKKKSLDGRAAHHQRRSSGNKKQHVDEAGGKNARRGGGNVRNKGKERDLKP